VTLSRLYVCLFSLYECLSCINPASWLPESNKCYVVIISRFMPPLHGQWTDSRKFMVINVLEHLAMTLTFDLWP